MSVSKCMEAATWERPEKNHHASETLHFMFFFCKKINMMEENHRQSQFIWQEPLKHSQQFCTLVMWQYLKAVNTQHNSRRKWERIWAGRGSTICTHSLSTEMLHSPSQSKDALCLNGWMSAFRYKKQNSLQQYSERNETNHTSFRKKVIIDYAG